MKGMKRLSVITEKGYALMAAIDAGLLEETEDGWNTEKFEKILGTVYPIEGEEPNKVLSKMAKTDVANETIIGIKTERNKNDLNSSRMILRYSRPLCSICNAVTMPEWLDCRCEI